MRPAENIKRLIQNLSDTTSAEMDEWVLTDVLRALAESEEPSALTWPNIKIQIIKSPLTKLAVAVVLTIACLTGLFFWKSTGSGVALADVLTRIEHVKAYMYKMSMTVTGQYFDDNPMNVEAQVTVLVSREHGIKINCETSPLPIIGKSMLQEMYILPPKKTITTLMPNEKKFEQMEYDETSLERMHKEYNNPGFMVKRILECEHTSLGKSTIDGIEVEGFQTTDPSFAGETFSPVDVRVEIWVDVKTRLPVRLEIDFNKEDKMNMHALVYDFQWDISVDAAEFEPVIPDDYTRGRPLMIIAPQKKAASDKGRR